MSDNNALNQAKAQADSIVAMVAALNVDYDRLEELRAIRDEVDTPTTQAGFASFDASDEGEELRELEDAAGDCTDEDRAREAIDNDPLSVEVRSGWHSPGSDDNKPSEFQILLCTGGPACRILGELDDYGTPYRAWLEAQDWGTPWQQVYIGDGFESGALLRYCQQFYFGE